LKNSVAYSSYSLPYTLKVAPQTPVISSAILNEESNELVLKWEVSNVGTSSLKKAFITFVALDENGAASSTYESKYRIILYL